MQNSVTMVTIGQRGDVPSTQVSVCLVLKHTGSYADFHPMASCDNTRDDKWRVLDTKSVCWGRGGGKMQSGNDGLGVLAPNWVTVIS